MQFFTLSLLALALGTSLASPYPPYPRHTHVSHEKRDIDGLRLIKRSRADPSLKLPVRIAIAQNNLDLGVEKLLDISDPQSANYGKHLTATEVGELFRPSGESIDAVRHWLHGSGINAERHTVSAGKGWLKFEASVEELESLLSTKYHLYEHQSTQESHIGCDEYHLPVHMTPHIDFVTPGVSTVQIGGEALKRNKRADLKPKAQASFPPIVRPAATEIASSDDITLPCHIAVTPDCIRSLYGIPQVNSSIPGNEIGIFEFGDYYDQGDLDLTFALISPHVPPGTHPTLDGIDGGTAPEPGFLGGESNLDFSIAYPLIYPQQAILYQVDDLAEILASDGFGDTFLDALDASFCTFEGGDDPSLDPHYPDLNVTSEGYNGTWGEPEMCGAYTPTNVISVSYGFGENKYSYFYENRQCQEYMKLGLQGVSVIYSSGDAGVSDRGACLGVNITVDTYANGAFSPSFPASCPWVTSVGATQFNDDDTTETAVNDPVQGFWSGGGFSNYWPAPSYQQTTLTNYFTNTPPPYNNLTAYGTPYYNKTGRGYPDVSALGLDYLMYLSGDLENVGGTSMSAPIFASIINLINEQRLTAGKSTVGFLNPTLYSNPQAFTDITTGSNPGCGVNGFDAVEGWDPVTGLGTPKFDELLAVFMALP